MQKIPHADKGQELRASSDGRVLFTDIENGPFCHLYDPSKAKCPAPRDHYSRLRILAASTGAFANNCFREQKTLNNKNQSAISDRHLESRLKIT